MWNYLKWFDLVFHQGTMKKRTVRMLVIESDNLWNSEKIESHADALKISKHSMDLICSWQS
jgi:hypothetical protein